MHAVKGGWVGQVFALATNNDAGGKKSRIRRSKEERKEMVESFIKKFQKSNNGNFPSLNLTHKEVGGSFYTVREIVREIIQDNRVLAPPKLSLEEYGHSGFLEQHPLGSISLEPHDDLSLSDRVHTVTPIVSNQDEMTREELNFSSRSQFIEPDPLEINKEHLINGLNKVAQDDKESDKAISSHSLPTTCQDASMEEVSNSIEQLPQHEGNDFGNKKIVNLAEVLQQNLNSDKPLATNFLHINHQIDKDESDLVYGQISHGLESRRLADEQYLNKNGQMVDRKKESENQLCVESVVEIVDKEKYGAKDAEELRDVASHVKSNFVVETFPLRPISRRILDLDGDSGKLHEFVESSSDFINENGKEELLDLKMELNGEQGEVKVMVNIQDPSIGSSNSTTSAVAILDVGDAKDLESKLSLADGTKVDVNTGGAISEESAADGGKMSSSQDKNSLNKGSNSTLDRINLETWEGASKKSTAPESNPLVTIVKAFISALVKFWTE